MKEEKRGEVVKIKKKRCGREKKKKRVEKRKKSEKKRKG